MRCSISIPQFDVDGFDAEGLRSYLARAEELGFEGGWAMEEVGANVTEDREQMERLAAEVIPQLD